MKLENTFEVPAGIEEAWEALLDVERIAPCMPGASIVSREGDLYRGSMKLKLGPMVTSFEGVLKIESADAPARRTVMQAEARDPRGKGTAAATISSTLAPSDAGTRVTVATDLRITGRLAQFGRGVMEEVSATLMNRFASALAEELTNGGAGSTGVTSANGGRTALPLPPPGARAGEPGRGVMAISLDDLRGVGADAEEDALDVLAVGREAFARRLIPAAAVAGLAAAAVLLLRSRRRAG